MKIAEPNKSQNKSSSANERFRAFLQREYVKRSERNPSYSLRSFARALNMNHGALSQILSGKRQLSSRMMRRMSSALQLGPSEIERLLAQPTSIEYIQLSQDHFLILSDWCHFAILELTHVQGFRPDINWIARVLKVSRIHARDCVERLFRFHLLKEDENTWVEAANENLSYGDTRHSTPARQKLQKQLFAKAYRAIQDIPYGERYHSGITMAVSSQKLPEAIQLIKNFRLEMNRLLSNSKTRDRVYHLSVALFPMSFEENKISKKERDQI